MIYNSLDELPIYNYFKCSEGHLQYLYEEYHKNTKITIELFDIWDKLQEDFSIATNDDSAVIMRLKYASVLVMVRQVLNLKNCHEMLSMRSDKDVVELLKLMNFNFDLNRKESELKRLKGHILNLEAKIKEKQPKEETTNLFEIAANIKKVLGFNFDVKTTSCSEFISYINLLKNGKGQTTI